MRFDPFPNSFRQSLLEAVGPALAHLATDQLPAECGPFTLHESCRVLFVDLPHDKQQVGDSMAPFIRRPVEVWHHQIHSNGQPLYYARTRTDAAGSHFVKVAQSFWAKRFAAILRLVESSPDPPGEELVVRLLVVPRYDDWAFGLYREVPGGSSRLVQVVPLLAEPEAARLGEGQYINRVQGRPSAVGLASA